MACPTCDHTVELITYHLWWCPRCGTLKSKSDPQQASAPFIVERARELCEEAHGFDAETDPTAMGLERRERALRECCLPEDQR